MTETYSSLHNHNDYSNASLGFPDSVNKYDKLIQTAYDLGLHGIAITNHECVSDHILDLKYYKDMQKDRPFKVVLGNEIYLLAESEDIGNREGTADTPFYHFLLNALNKEGHKQLRELSDRAWKRAYTYRGLMRRPTYYSDLEDIIRPNQGNVVASSACLGGVIPKMITSGNTETAINAIKYFDDLFGHGNFYLEIQPCTPRNLDQLEVNEFLAKVGKELGIKVIVTTDSHYLSKEDSFNHKVFLNAKDGGGEREVDDFYETTYLMSAKELREYLRLSFDDDYIDYLFDNTNEIMDRAVDYDFEHTPMIPQLPLDKIPPFEIEHRYKDYYEKYPEFGYYAHAKNIQDKYFFYKIEQSLYELIEINCKDLEKYIARLNDEFHELRLISEAFNDSMASYYTTMAKIIDLIWNTDSLSMPARGSGAGFLVCYLFGITQIDPVPLGSYFPFWRHLSAERGVEIADIDNDSQNAKRDDIIQALKDYFGEDRVLNVATFSTVSAKIAIEKAGLGLKNLGYSITDETIGYLKSLIPIERGKIWSLSDCINGNESKGRKRVTELVNELDKYEHLLDCALAFEGLIANRGIHASGVLIGNNPYVDQITSMRSPTGVLCSCYDLHDSEYCGWTKVDILTIQASDKIRKCMDLLIEHGYMEWQGSLKATYWKYLHPDVLDYKTKEMWDSIQSIYSIFQFDTPVAVKALNQVQPHSVMDLSSTNSLLRLQTEGNESPLDRYARYKKDIKEWYKDMTEYGLTLEEQEVLKDHLGDCYGLAESQEKVMLLSMDKRISGFSLKDANKLRKAIAKKKEDVLNSTKELFFNSCAEQGTSETMANYIWNEEFGMSFGYSFSQLHSYSYSVIALQELNLNYYYPTVFWNTACLTVESQSDETNERAKGQTDYGKVAKAIYKMRKFGNDVLPPNINKSNISFTPNPQTNSILFGLGGISGVNLDIASQIVNNRPYANFAEFYDKCNALENNLVTKSIYATLIKSGCFDETDDKAEAMRYLVEKTTPLSTSLTRSNIPMALSMGMDINNELLMPYYFYKAIISKENFYKQDPKFKSKKHYLIPSTNGMATDYFYELADQMKEETDYYFVNEGIVVIDKSLEKRLKEQFEALNDYINSEKFLAEFNKRKQYEAYISLAKSENVTKWSFDSTAFYPKGEHELKNINYNAYNLSHFSDLSETPTFVEKTGRNGFTWKQYDLHKICGTIIDKKDKDHIVTILTPDEEVVNVSMSKGQYAFYKQEISIGDQRDSSWLKRGNLIMVCGYRRGDDFFAKKYRNSVFQHSITLITNCYEDGSADLVFERLQEEED